MKELRRQNAGVWELVRQVLVPMMIYYVVDHMVVMAGMEIHEAWQESGSVGGTWLRMAGMALGGAAVLPYYKKEKRSRKNIASCHFSKGKWFLAIFLGGILSLGLNLLFSASGFIASDEVYHQVAEVQFSLPLWLAFLFYGCCSPLVEELVFRGIVYSALCRNMTNTWGIIGSALLFGAFHGNVVQMVYAFLMGIVMAYLYQKYQTLSAPILFHSAANVAAYLLTYWG